MSALLEELNLNMGDLVERAGQSLVKVASGGRGFGSGSIWHSGGLIITNSHVISGSQRRGRQGRNTGQDIRVTLPGGETLPARLLAQDPENDLAALSVDAKEFDLAAIPLGQSRSLQPGQWVTAMGHPWGVPGAATSGAVIGWGSDLRSPVQQSGPGVDSRGAEPASRTLRRAIGRFPRETGGNLHHDGRARSRHGRAGPRGKRVLTPGIGGRGFRLIRLDSWTWVD